jgi:hypothetical protein
VAVWLALEELDIGHVMWRMLCSVVGVARYSLRATPSPADESSTTDFKDLRNLAMESVLEFVTPQQ